MIYQDLRYAVRSLRKRPFFAAIVVTTLALCIGANTAIFSIVDSVLLRGLPFRQPDRLVAVSEILSDVMSGDIPFSAPDYEELVRRNRSFQQLGIYSNQHYELSGRGEPDRLEGARVSASLFPTLGISPSLGRNFTEQEDRQAHRVAILSSSLWHSKFGGDPKILGQTVLLDRIPYTVVGVMSDRNSFPLRGPAFNNSPAEIYVPIGFTKLELEDIGNMYNHSVIARLRPGATLAQARADVKSIAIRLYQNVYPANLRASNFVLSADVRPLRDEIVGKAEPILLVLFGAVGLVLLIGCADVAGLLLTRAASRRRELAIRTALGADRRALICQVLLESLVLALGGGALGLLLSVWITTVLKHFVAMDVPLANRVAVDAHVLLFTLGVSVFTALLFGLFPAMEASQVEVNEGLREGSRGQTAGRKHGRTLSSLVVAQFALALVLLVGAGLLVRSFSRLLATNPGFRADHVLTMSVSLPATDYKTGAQVRTFYERLQQSLQSIPGVKATAVATSLPLSINEHRTFSIEHQAPETLSIPRTVAQIWPLGDFFDALAIPLKRGRLFDPRDTRNSLPVAIINQTLARRFFHGQNPIGQRLKWGENNSKDPWKTVVGVVGDVKQGAMNEQVEAETYTPYEQVSEKDLGNSVMDEWRALKVIVRTANDPVRENSAVQKRIWQLDSSLPVTEIQTMEVNLRDSTRPERFNTILLGAFAAIAVLLAALGIAGVLAYSVAQRIAEMGLRFALGATKADVIGLVLKRGMGMALLGTGTGLVCALAITRVMSSLLFETSPFDAWTLCAAPLLLLLIGVLSIWIPAQRAAAVDPIQALRVE
jgi:predicted permease